MVISTIILLSTILKQTTESTGSLLNALPTVRSTIYFLLTSEQTLLKRCQQLPAHYKRLIADNNKTDKQ